MQARLRDLTVGVRAEKIGEVAAEFEAIHDIERAQKVGSVDVIISAKELRPYLVDALERGMAREANRASDAPQTRGGASIRVTVSLPASPGGATSGTGVGNASAVVSRHGQHEVAEALPPTRERRARRRR